jgi:hypothetical protein
LLNKRIIAKEGYFFYYINMKSRSSLIAIEILSNKSKSFQGCLNICIDRNLITDKTLRLFVVWCYRLTLEWIDKPDSRSFNAANVAEKYALGEATNEELNAACSAVESAWSAARSAACSAASSSAWSIAWSFADSAKSSARSAAWHAAESAGQNAKNGIEERERNRLIEMIEEELIE